VGYFDEKKSVDEYIKMAEGYDGRELIEILKKYLQSDSTILELGMGPGKDFEIFGRDFNVTGSDNSQVFIEIYKGNNSNADIFLLDAVKMNTKRRSKIFSGQAIIKLKQQWNIVSLILVWR